MRYIESICADCGFTECRCGHLEPEPARVPVNAAPRLRLVTTAPAAPVKVGPPPAHIRARLAELRAELAR